MLVGGFASGNITASSGLEIQKQFSLNFETAYFIARPLLQQMQKNSYGRLVFIGARPAINPAQGKDLVAYALTKSLLFKLAAFVNEENKGTNVVASVVVPVPLILLSTAKACQMQILLIGLSRSRSQVYLNLFAVKKDLG
ncbi:hypothetical protein BH10BAC2_BH10BAC2_05400 [soil metagenome]